LSYWKKRKVGWLPRYWCDELKAGLIQRPKWCLFARHNGVDHKYCEGCPKRMDEKPGGKR